VSRRNPAAKGRADANHKAIADAIRAIGYPVMDLSAAGNGVEDLLVGLRRYDPNWARYDCWWLVVEAKNLKGRGLRFTDDQVEWRDRTQGWPRITVTSGQDAVDQIRKMTDRERC
jgi:hypothetical protein